MELRPAQVIQMDVTNMAVMVSIASTVCRRARVPPQAPVIQISATNGSIDLPAHRRRGSDTATVVFSGMLDW